MHPFRLDEATGYASIRRKILINGRLQTIRTIETENEQTALFLA